MGAEAISAKSRQDLALEFRATHIISEQGADGVTRIEDVTDGVGAESVLECAGAQESMLQAIASARASCSIGFVGVPHSVELDGQQPFLAQKNLLGGPAPARRFLPDLIKLAMSHKINPGKVVDLECLWRTSLKVIAP
jgi:threonine dehydrogenase-like Zn-dependent dehydrogenase